MSSTTNHNDNNNGGSGKGWRALHSPENRPPHEESNGSSSSSSSPSCNHNAFIRAIHAMSSSYFNGELRQAMAGAKEETKAFIRREFAAEREKVISVLDDAWQRFSLAVVNEQVELAFAKMTAQMETANEDIFRRALATDGVGSAFLRELTQAATCEVVLGQAQAQAEAEVGVKNLERAQQLYHLRARTFDKARARAEEAAQAQKRKAEEMEEEQEEDEEDDIRSIPGTPPPPRQPPPLILSLPPTTSLKALEQLPASKSNRPLSNEEQRGGIFPFSLSSADPLLPSTSFLAFKSATSTGGGGGGGATKTASTTTTKKPRTKKLTTLEDVAEALEAMEASSSSSSPISVPVVVGQHQGQLNNKKKKLAVEQKQQQRQKPLPPLFKAENSSSSSSSSVQSAPVVPKISASASSASASLFQASTVVVSPSPSIGQVYQVLHPHHPPHRPRTPRPPKVHRTLLIACAQPSCGRLLPPGLEVSTHQLAAHGLGPYICYAPHCLLGGDVRVSFDQPHDMSVHIQALHPGKTLPWACPLCWWALPREQRTAAGRRPELAFKGYSAYAAHIADYHVKGRYACRYPGCRFPHVDLVHKVREHYALVHGGGGGSGSVAAIAGPAAGKAQVKVEVKVEAEDDGGDKKEEVKPSEKPKDGGEKESAEKKPPPNKKPANRKGKRSANKVVNSSSSGGGGGEGPPVKSEDTADDDGEAGDDPLAATSSSPRAARLHARVIRFNKVGANN